MTYPWMKSKFVDKDVICTRCKVQVPPGASRYYNTQDRTNMCEACWGAMEMRDNYSPPQPAASPSREERIEKAHAENVEWAKAQYDALMHIREELTVFNATLRRAVDAMGVGHSE